MYKSPKKRPPEEYISILKSRKHFLKALDADNFRGSLRYDAKTGVCSLSVSQQKKAPIDYLGEPVKPAQLVFDLCTNLETIINERSKLTGQQFPKCPLTQSYIRNPVIASDGQIYERDYIVHYLDEHAEFDKASGQWKLPMSPLRIGELSFELTYATEEAKRLNQLIEEANDHYRSQTRNASSQKQTPSLNFFGTSADQDHDHDTDEFHFETLIDNAKGY
jgi:hypothetical protein